MINKENYVVFHDENTVHPARSFRIRGPDRVVQRHLLLEQRKRHIDGYDRFARYVRRFAVSGHVAIDAVLLLDLVLKELHFGALAVNEQHVLRFTVLDELHDALGVRVGAE